MKHTINNPLKLIWCEHTNAYKVNKPNQETQELVSKEVAESLLEALKELLKFQSELIINDGKHSRERVKAVIKAEQAIKEYEL